MIDLSMKIAQLLIYQSNQSKYYIIHRLAMLGGHKKKYCMDEFISMNRANPIIESYGPEKNNLVCICGKSEDKMGRSCFKCCSLIHDCLSKKCNRGQLFECSSCLNKSLDPLIQVRKVLVESYFKTYSIFEYNNIFNFQFTLSPQDLKFGVQIRGLVPENTCLTWPMQGQFFLNDEKSSFHELKPLLINSNRKGRREEYFNIPHEKLRAGKNYIRFKIPCLDRAKFVAKYQHEEKKVYYFAVNSTVRLTSTDLESQTFRQRRIEKSSSLKILQMSNADVEVTKNKVCLVCPYTRERIIVPIRGRYCKHFSCICLRTLVSTHSSSRHWGCPICEEKMNEPYVDVWFFAILKDNQVGSEVLMNEDGSYVWLRDNVAAVMDLESDEESAPIPLKKTSVGERQKAETKTIETNRQLDVGLLLSEQLLKKKEQVKWQEILKLAIKDNSDQLSSLKPTLPKPAPIQQKKEVLPTLEDIPTMQLKEMSVAEFKKSYFKGKGNGYRRYWQTQQITRLFKQIL